MGMCKKCGVVYSSLKMIDGVCEDCRDSEKVKVKEKENESLYSSKQLFSHHERTRLLSTYSNELVYSLSYLGGITELDDLTINKKISPIPLLACAHANRGISIEFNIVDAEMLYLVLPYDKVMSWTIEAEEDIVNYYDRSVIGRALLGGVILGPIGAIIGGMTGLKDKKVIAGKGILTLMCNIAGKDIVVLFSFETKHTSVVSDWFSEHIPNKYKRPSDIVFDNTSKQATTSSMSIADEIRKFKDLMDEGILTKEEFEIQKTKLLNQ